MGGKAPEQAGTIDTNSRQRTASRSTGTNTVTLPSFLQPFVQGQVGQAGNAQNAFSSLTQGDLAADLTANQQAALSQMANFGQSQPYQSALDGMMSTAGGDYLYGGPAQQAFVDAATRSAMPGVISQFGGRGGSGLAAANMGQYASDAYARLYGDERERQMQALRSLPTLAATPIDMQLQAGGIEQQQAQNEINAPIQAAQDRWNMAMGALPITSLLGSAQKGTSLTKQRGTNQQPYFENQGAGALGGAMSGASLGSSFGPLGAIAGGIGGGLLGLL